MEYQVEAQIATGIRALLATRLSGRSQGSVRGESSAIAAIVVVLVSLWLPLVHYLTEKRQDDLAQAQRDVTNISVMLDAKHN